MKYFDKENGMLNLTEECRQTLYDINMVVMTQDLSQRGNSKFVQTLINNQSDTIKDAIQNSLGDALISGDEKLATYIIEKNILKPYNDLQQFLANKNMCHEIGEEYEDWDKVIEDQDSEIAEIGQDMSQYEDSLSENSKYAKDAYIGARTSVDGLSQAENLANMSKDDLALSFDEILKTQLPIEDVNFLADMIDYVNDTNETEKVKESLSDELMEIRKNIDKTQEMLKGLEQEYAEKANLVKEACHQKSSPYYQGVNTSASQMAKDIAMKAGTILNDGYDKSIEFFEKTTEKIKTLNKELNFKMAKVIEFISGGSFSRSYEQVQKTANKMDKFPDFKYSPMEKISSYYIKHENLDIKKLKEEVWQDAISPLDKFIAKADLTKENISTQIDLFKKEIKNMPEKIKDDFIQVRSQVEDEITSLKDKIKNECLEIHAQILDKKANLMVKNAERLIKREEKYINIDKMAFQAKENIAKEINSFTSIHPYAKKTYELSDEIKSITEIIDKFKNTPAEKLVNAHFKNVLKETQKYEKVIDKLNAVEEKIAAVFNQADLASVKANELRSQKETVNNQDQDKEDIDFE